MGLNWTEDHTGVWSVRLESREIIVEHECAVILRIHLEYNGGIYQMIGVACI